MLTLIGAFLGFIGSFAPALLKFWTQKEDHKHELAVMDLQMRAQAQAHTERLEEINTNADIQESLAQMQAAKLAPSGVAWVDAFLYFLNGTVRPVVTYWYFAIYQMTKYAIYLQVRAGGATWAQAAASIWTEVDMAMFGTVMGFWFGQRQLAKYMAKAKS